MGPVSTEADRPRTSPQGATPASADALQAEIDAARDGLATSIAQIKEQTSPAALVRRGRNAVTGFFVDEYGGVRPERVAMVAGAVVTLVVMRRWRRARRLRSICACR